MILVTGAAGFIGRALCEELSRKNWLVRAASRSVVNFLPSVEIVSIGNIGSTTEWGGALNGVDVVIHLAGLAHVPAKVKASNISDYWEVNTLGTARLARQSAAKGVRRFLYVSTAKVCGETTYNRPFDETDLSSSNDPYTFSKREAEKLLRNIADETGMEVVIVRPPLVYGPRVKANFHNMMRWLYSGIPLPLGSIRNRRSLVALDNLLDFILVSLNHPMASNQTFLVSDGDDISTTELLQRMAIALHVTARLIPVPQGLLERCAKVIGRDDLSKRLCDSSQVDISKARTLLGWRPCVTMEESLSRTAVHFLSSLRKDVVDEKRF